MIFTGIMHIRQESARLLPQDAYVLNYEKEIDMEAGANYRLRVWLKNGDVAWVSPIFVEK